MGEVRSSRIAFAAAYIALVAGLFFALGGMAYAQSSAGDQYGDKVAGVSVSATESATEAQQVASQTLPSTGLSLLAVAIVGGGLVAAGIALRRRERRSDD